MPRFEGRPTCDSCWFARVKNVRVADILGIYEDRPICLRDPVPVTKEPGDFCQNHPAWPEFEARMQGCEISEFYEHFQSPV